ncbi:uncharacterized protein [Rutidosis leptorrhynchoides]|uniref:uncharacterized protein n=1 Tax=Rutidosis leptorrhynchoides TaxID=125765 RepID=UPI003A9967C6
MNIRGLNFNGMWNENPLDIKEAAVKHFEKIFTSSTTYCASLEDLRYRKISDEEALNLEAPFCEKEIWDAISDCGSSKAPGPDGFNMGFFKKFWYIIKDDLVEVEKGYPGSHWYGAVRLLERSASISILINGSPTNEFKMGRGVRQGDPLSPSLFIIAAEGLNILTSIAVKKGLFKGVKVGNNNTVVSHLQYADDTMIGVKKDDVESLASRLGCQYGTIPFLCLGLPVGSKMKKSKAWSPISAIVLAGTEVDNLGVPFTNSFIKIFGDGVGTSYWNEEWIGGYKVKNKFSRLFKLETDVDAEVRERIVGNGSDARGNWRWSRNPTGRTLGELEELERMLKAYGLDNSSKDTTKWILDNKGLFSVKKLSVLLDEKVLDNYKGNFETLHNNLMPKKVEVFLWRTLLHRLPVRTELDKRGVDLHSVTCPICDDDLETVEHIIWPCKTANDVWTRVFKWWNINFSGNTMEDLLRGTTSLFPSVSGQKIWQTVNWICGYVIWKNRNQKAFNNKSMVVSMLMQEFQILTFDWISRRIKGVVIDWIKWLSNPSTYAV